MKLRIGLSRFLLQLGDLIQTLPVALMRPDDLIEFSRQTYAKPQDVESWAEDALVDAGLNPVEQRLLEEIPARSGNLLVLGVGGGREAIPLARMGFHVTGVDYVPQMVKRAVENAARRGVKIKGIAQEISKLDMHGELFDVIWLSSAMYSSVPSRERRIAMVQRVAGCMKHGGFFLCQFHYNPGLRKSKRVDRVHRLVSILTQGNLSLQEGDLLWQNVEFLHAFRSTDEVCEEIEDGGLVVRSIHAQPNSNRGAAICAKGA